MTTVHVLPVNVSASAAQRLADDLAAAFESGVDLGSRLPHIRKLLELLQHSVEVMRAEADVIAADAHCTDPR